MISCEEEAEDDEEENNEEEVITKGKEIVVSLNPSVVGLGTLETMKMMGELRGRKVVVLIDSEATYNFISERLVNELQIPVKKPQFSVILGNGRKVKGMGRCEGVVLNLQGVVVYQDFLPFALGRVDIILRVDWLHRLGE